MCFIQLLITALICLRLRILTWQDIFVCPPQSNLFFHFFPFVKEKILFSFFLEGSKSHNDKNVRPNSEAVV